MSVRIRSNRDFIPLSQRPAKDFKGCDNLKCVSDDIAITKDKQFFYHNVSIFNDSKVATPAIYSEKRDGAILENPSLWNLSVIRFTVPAQTIPIFSFEEDEYIVTINDNIHDNSQSTIVAYEPLNNQEEGASDYFYVYDYDRFIHMINNAIQESYSILNGESGPYTGYGFAPYLSFDPTTDLITMNMPSQFRSYPGTSTEPQFSLYFNSKLYRFFQSFWVDQLTNVDNTISYEFQAFNKGTGNYKLFTDLPEKESGFTGMNYPTSYTGYAMTQDFATLYNWNSFRNITFLTSYIPVTSETLNNVGSPNGDDFKPILTDFEVQTQQGFDVHSYIQYYPQGEYRLISLSGEKPMTTLDFQLFWRDREQNLYPITIPPGDSISVKLMFRRKDYQEGV